MNWWIGGRPNPQLKKPYYVAMGRLPAKTAKAREDCLYGAMYITRYSTKREYTCKISQLKSDGFTVHEN